MKNLDPIEKKLGLSLPPEIAALYAKNDGEPKDTGGYRLLSVDEIKSAPFEAYWEGRRGEILRHWGWTIWPFFTNDNSDYLCLFLNGPLTGWVCEICHDDTNVTLVAGDVTTVVKRIKAARKESAEEPSHPSEYRDRQRVSAAAAERDWEAAKRLRDFFRARPPTFDADVVADFVRKLALPKHESELRALLAEIGLARFAVLRGEKLLFAVAAGKLDEVIASLDAGVDVNEKVPLYGTILSRAAAYGKVDVMKLALSRGADVHLDVQPGPLELAAQSDKSLAAVELLIEAGIDVRGAAGQKALANAVSSRARKVEALLRRHGASGATG